jgi:hypothetical protein
MPTAIWNGMFDDHGVSPVIFDVILGLFHRREEG